MSMKFEGYPHIIDSHQFSPEWINEILFPLANRMEKRECIGNKVKSLVGKEMVSFFVGESLRTRASFEIAFRRLGGEVIFGSEAARKFSSMAKGESLEDTIVVLNEYLMKCNESFDGYSGVIVLRTDQEGDAARAAEVSQVPVINAGDGPGQHPTQALLDLYTIQKHLGGINGISIAMIGDLVGSRTIHSLAYLLGKYSDVKMYFVSPEHLQIRAGIKEYLLRHNIAVQELRDLREVAGLVDVFYQTRTQTNFGTEKWDRKDETNGFTIIDKEVLSLAKKNAIILHPLPCTDEIIREEVDEDPRAVYLKTKNGKMSQVRAGVYIRQALFSLIFSSEQ